MLNSLHTNCRIETQVLHIRVNLSIISSTGEYCSEPPPDLTQEQSSSVCAQSAFCTGVNPGLLHKAGFGMVAQVRPGFNPQPALAPGLAEWRPGRSGPPDVCLFRLHPGFIPGRASRAQGLMAWGSFFGSSSPVQVLSILFIL